MALIHNTILTTDITYSSLVSLVNASTLAVGHYYKITDYRTIYVQPYTNTVYGAAASALPSKPFPIIVYAATSNTLSHDAWAVPTVDFPNAGTWKIKYDINIPVTISGTPTYTTKYAWADSTSVGVIYEMIDENNNKASYDFKNVRFVRYKSKDYYPNVWPNGLYYEYNPSSSNADLPTVDNFYTFNYNPSATVGGNLDYSNVSGATNNLYNNVIAPFIDANPFADYDRYIFYLNNNVFLGETGSVIANNTFGPSCGFNTFGKDTVYNTFCSEFSQNLVNQNAKVNRFGSIVNSNTFDSGMLNNVFGDNCSNNIIGTDFVNNKIGNDFTINTIGNSSNDNKIGDNFQLNLARDGFTDNVIGTHAGFNTLGVNFSSNIAGSNFNGNTIQDNCTKNSFGTVFNSNTIAAGCTKNSFGCQNEGIVAGVNFANNSFGNNVTGILVENYVDSNSIGNSCDSITLSNYSSNNVFENGVYDIAIGGAHVSGYSNNRFRSGVNTITFEDITFSNVDFMSGNSLVILNTSNFWDYATSAVPLQFISREDGVIVLVYMATNGTFQTVELIES